MSLNLYAIPPSVYINSIPYNQRCLLRDMGAGAAIPRLLVTLSKPAVYTANINGTEVEFQIPYFDLLCSFVEFCRAEYDIQGPFVKGSLGGEKILGEKILEGDSTEITDYDFSIEGFPPDFKKWHDVEALFLASLAKIAGITYVDSGNLRRYFWKGKELCSAVKNPAFKYLSHCGQFFISCGGLKNRFTVANEEDNHHLITIPTKIEEGVSNLDFFFVAKASAQAFSDVDSQQIDLGPYLEEHYPVFLGMISAHSAQKYIRNCEGWVKTVDGYVIGEISRHRQDRVYFIKNPEKIKDALKLYCYRNVKGKSPVNERSHLEEVFCASFVKEFYENGKFLAEKFQKRITGFFASKPFFHGNPKMRILYLIDFSEVIGRHLDTTREIDLVLAHLVVVALNQNHQFTEDNLLEFFLWAKAHAGTPKKMTKRPIVPDALQAALSSHFTFSNLGFVMVNPSFYTDATVDEFIGQFDKKQFGIGCALYEKCKRRDLYKLLYVQCADSVNCKWFQRNMPDGDVNDLLDAKPGILEFEKLPKEGRAHLLKTSSDLALFERSLKCGDRPDMDRLVEGDPRDKKEVQKLLYFAAHSHAQYLPLFEKTLKWNLPSAWDYIKKLAPRHHEKVRDMAAEYVRAHLNVVEDIPRLPFGLSFCLYEQLEFQFKNLKSQKQMLAAFCKSEKLFFELKGEEFTRAFTLFIHYVGSHRDNKVYEVLSRGLKMVEYSDVEGALKKLDLSYLRLVPQLKGQLQVEEPPEVKVVSPAQLLQEGHTPEDIEKVILGSYTYSIEQIDKFFTNLLPKQKDLSLLDVLYRLEAGLKAKLSDKRSSALLGSVYRFHIKLLIQYNEQYQDFDATEVPDEQRMVFDLLTEACMLKWIHGKWGFQIEEYYTAWNAMAPIMLATQASYKYLKEHLAAVLKGNVKSPLHQINLLTITIGVIIKSNPDSARFKDAVSYFKEVFKYTEQTEEKNPTSFDKALELLTFATESVEIIANSKEEYVEFAEMLGGIRFPKYFEVWLSHQERGVERAIKLHNLRAALAFSYTAEVFNKKEDRIQPALQKVLDLIEISLLNEPISNILQVVDMVSFAATRAPFEGIATLLPSMSSFVQSGVANSDAFLQNLPVIHALLRVAAQRAVKEHAPREYLASLYLFHMNLICESIKHNQDVYPEYILFFGVLEDYKEVVSEAEYTEYWVSIVPLFAKNGAFYTLLKNALVSFSASGWISPSLRATLCYKMMQHMLYNKNPTSLKEATDLFKRALESGGANYISCYELAFAIFDRRAKEGAKGNDLVELAEILGGKIHSEHSLIWFDSMEMESKKRVIATLKPFCGALLKDRETEIEISELIKANQKD